MKKITLGLSLAALVAGGAAYADHHGQRPDMDTDGNGVVTRAEAQAHAGTMFAKMDANGDGKLDETDRAARKEERRTKMFEALDADSNGQISRSEFMAGNMRGGPDGDGGKHHRMGKRGGHGKMMEMADANKDGAISKAEFTAGAMQHFDRMDANKDGQVTAEEKQAARDAMRAKWRERSDS